MRDTGAKWVCFTSVMIVTLMVIPTAALSQASVKESALGARIAGLGHPAIATSVAWKVSLTSPTAVYYFGQTAKFNGTVGPVFKGSVANVTILNVTGAVNQTIHPSIKAHSGAFSFGFAVPANVSGTWEVIASYHSASSQVNITITQQRSLGIFIMENATTISHTFPAETNRTAPNPPNHGPVGLFGLRQFYNNTTTTKLYIASGLANNSTYVILTYAEQNGSFLDHTFAFVYTNGSNGRVIAEVTDDFIPLGSPHLNLSESFGLNFTGTFHEELAALSTGLVLSAKNLSADKLGKPAMKLWATYLNEMNASLNHLLRVLPGWLGNVSVDTTLAVVDDDQSWACSLLNDALNVLMELFQEALLDVFTLAFLATLCVTFAEACGAALGAILVGAILVALLLVGLNLICEAESGKLASTPTSNPWQEVTLNGIANPSAMLYFASTLFIADPVAESVDAVNTFTNSIEFTVPIGGSQHSYLESPSALLEANTGRVRNILVASPATSSIVLFDAASGRVVGTTAEPDPMQLASDPSNNLVYVVNYYPAYDITSFNPSTLVAGPTIHMPSSGDYPISLTWNPDQGAFVGFGWDSVFGGYGVFTAPDNGGTPIWVYHYSYGEGVEWGQVLFEPATNQVFVSGYDDFSLIVFNAYTLAKVTSYGSPSATGSIACNGNYFRGNPGVFLTFLGGTHDWVINAASGQVSRTQFVAGSSSISYNGPNIAFNSDLDVVYQVSGGNPTVLTVFDGQNIG